jgi:predicted nucleic-acid-binding Zn-ribbon protein
MAGFWARMKRAASQAVSPREYEAAGRQIVCPHCGGSTFDKSEAQLNTAGMSFLNLDWANRSATTLTCSTCSRIEWFLERPREID